MNRRLLGSFLLTVVFFGVVASIGYFPVYAMFAISVIGFAVCFGGIWALIDSLVVAIHFDRGS